MGGLLAGVLMGTAALYTLAAVAHLLFIFRRGFDALARWSTRAAWLSQSLGLVLLLVHTGRPPAQTLFEFAYFFTWVMVTNYVVIEAFRQNQSPGALLLPIVAIMQAAAIALPKPGIDHPGMEALPVGLLGWHIGVIMLGYGFLTASCVAGALYLIQERNLRLKRWGPLYYRLPSLEVLDIWGGRFVMVGFPLLTVGIGSGLLFARQSWEAFWHDPKVLFTFVVWLFYGAYLLMRKYWGWGGRKAAWWSVAGVAILLINYFVVNLLSRLHRFGV
jgi:ABC-type transport system involved in cytochrome c biogenesis permease subunit